MEPRADERDEVEKDQECSELVRVVGVDALFGGGR